PTGAWLLASIPISAIGGLYSPAAQDLMTSRVGPGQQGQLQGALSSLLGVGSLFSPGLYTQTFARSIDGTLGTPLPGVPFFLAAGLLLVALVVAYGSTRAEPALESAR